jgi:hypothetical protein
LYRAALGDVRDIHNLQSTICNPRSPTMPTLSDQQLSQYHRDGFVVVPGLFAAGDCDAFVAHMMALHAGRTTLGGFIPRQPDDFGRTHNQHLYDPVALDFLLAPQLRRPLAQCFEDEPDAVQTMYFWVGSEQRRHQDAYYLPACMSAWIALTDVGPENGTIHVQPGSHTRRLWTRADFVAEHGEDVSTFGEHYNDRIDEQFAANSQPEIAVVAAKGDVVFFHGTLIHRGGPIGRPGTFRHVLACHYIPYCFDGWPYAGWPRISFDRERRDTAAT